MKRRIVHYTNRGGRYGNQLVQFAHWIAYACEHPGTEVCFIPYWSLADLSIGTEENRFCFFPFDRANPPRRGLLLRLAHALLSDPKRRRFSMWFLDRLLTPLVGRRQARLLSPARWGLGKPVTGPADLELPTGTIPLTVQIGDADFNRALDQIGSTFYGGGYGFRSWPLVEKHQASVRAFLAPAKRFQESATRFISPLRARYRTLIGVFIRQGDYRGWLDGMFYLETSRYVELMRSLATRYDDPCFIIASDQPQDPAAFGDLPVAFAPGEATGSGHYLENVAALAKCDFIVTVPSTSGVFPAFFGGVPIIPIYGRQADILAAPILREHLFDALRDRVMMLSVN